MSLSRLPCEHIFLTGNPGVGKTTAIVETAKAILLESSSTTLDDVDVRVRGFYTEECRDRNGDRVGFDIVHLPKAGLRLNKSLGENVSLDSIVRRDPLSRVGTKGSGPMVGKYVVDVNGIERVAVPSIDPDTYGAGEAPSIDLVLLDEVGKMEMLCPAFLPAVQRALGCGDDDISGRRRIVLGTIPTPRYGRVIKAVEDIRARPDVTVVYVTKANRDELREAVKRTVLAALGIRGDGGASDADGGNTADLLRPFLYSRKIGAPSMNDKPASDARASRVQSNDAPPSALLGPRLLTRRQQPHQQPSSSAQSEPLKPCGPLMHETIESTVLLLGETASAQPAEMGMEYSERSLWIVFADIVLGRPLQKDSKTDFLKLRDSILSTGIAIWDVLSDIHGAASKKSGRGKRPKKDSYAGTANQIQEFLRDKPSIQAVAFIGAKARKTFGNHFTTIVRGDELILPGGRSVRLVILPSSSRANSRMSVIEKSKAWVEALSDFCPKLKDQPS